MGTQFPKLQVWRANSSQGPDFYFKPGKDIQVDAEGTACEILTKTCGQIFQCRLSKDHQVSVQSGDILGVELPPLNDSAFELFFLINRLDLRQNHFVFRHQLSSMVHIGRTTAHSFYHRGDQLLLNLELSLGTFQKLIHSLITRLIMELGKYYHSHAFSHSIVYFDLLHNYPSAHAQEGYSSRFVCVCVCLLPLYLLEC